MSLSRELKNLQIDMNDLNLTTPPVSESPRVVPAARAFGGLLGKVKPGEIVRFPINEAATVDAALAMCASARLVSLEAFVLPTAAASADIVKAHFGWGHVEHGYPDSVDQLAQLPAFAVVLFPPGEVVPASDRTLACEFDTSITPLMKPVALEGGRPALFVHVTRLNDEGKSVSGDALAVYFRLKMQTAGYDITFV